MKLDKPVCEEHRSAKIDTHYTCRVCEEADRRVRRLCFFLAVIGMAALTLLTRIGCLPRTLP